MQIDAHKQGCTSEKDTARGVEDSYSGNGSNKEKIKLHVDLL